MKEQIDFHGRVAAVTGGASGIGRGIATEFAKEGADVALLDIDEEEADAAAAELMDDHGITATVCVTDVSDYESCQAAADHILDEFGRIDVLANCAAGALRTPEHMSQPFLEESPEAWEPHIHVTFKGVLNATHAVLPHMVEAGQGSVISIVSDSYLGQDPNLAVYGSAKAGIATFTKTVAKEVGEHGVRLNAISPGTTRTPSSEDFVEQYGDKIVQSYPLRRLGLPEDHANAAVFLSSDAADWITGQVLSVNGGFI